MGGVLQSKTDENAAVIAAVAAWGSAGPWAPAGGVGGSDGGTDSGPAGALASTCRDTVPRAAPVLSLTWSWESAPPRVAVGSPARTMTASPPAGASVTVPPEPVTDTDEAWGPTSTSTTVAGDPSAPPTTDTRGQISGVA